jgi:elongator complex protein 2
VRSHLTKVYPRLIQYQGLILAIASTGKDVNIWTGTENQVNGYFLAVIAQSLPAFPFLMQFVHSASLSGHEDWVKSLAFTQSRYSPPQLTLASGSQDGTIRLWTVDPVTPTRSQAVVEDDLLDAFEASLGDFSEGEEGGRQMSTKRHIVATKSVDGK